MDKKSITINWQEGHQCHVLVLSEMTTEEEVDELIAKLQEQPNILIVKDSLLVDHFIIEHKEKGGWW